RAYSDDGGTTWSSAANVTASTTLCDGAIPLFLSNGKTAIVYLNQGSNYPTTFRLETVVSSDGGTTFGTPTAIVTASMFQSSTFRSQKGKPSAAVDRTTGNIYVTYTALSSGSPKIFFTKSTDTGAHWSTPVVISDNPTAFPVFNPAIAVSADGSNVTVCFYDMRNDPNGNRFIDLYLTQSLDGGKTWRQPNTRVTNVPSDITLAPNTEGGYMLGDYLGIAEATSTAPAVPIWIDTRNGNPDPYSAQ